MQVYGSGQPYVRVSVSVCAHGMATVAALHLCSQFGKEVHEIEIKHHIRSTASVLANPTYTRLQLSRAQWNRTHLRQLRCR